MTKEPRSDISPVLQFVLILVPIVMSSFFLIYAMSGIGLEEPYRQDWVLEARTVALYVGGGIALFSILVLLYVRYKQQSVKHPLSISGLGHLILAILLTVVVFIVSA